MMPMYERNVRRLAQGEQLDDPALSVRLFVAKHDQMRAELSETVRTAQVQILRELLGADDPNFPRKSARDLVLSFMDKLQELERQAR